MKRTTCSWWLGALAASLVATPSVADRSAPTSTEALVRDALQAEIAGDNVRRGQLLGESVSLAPQNPAAHWQQGELLANGKWRPASAASMSAGADQRLSEYRRLRDQAEYSVADQLRLANWCRDNKLTDQERAHLTSVLKLDHANVEARTRLGLTEVDGRLLTKEQIKAEEMQALYNGAKVKQWKSELAALRRQLSSKSTDERKQALARLRAISDPDAIPALEAVFAPAGPDVARVAIGVIARMNGHAATKSLVRWTVLAKTEEARLAAADALRTQRKQYFVPILLSGLRFPVESTVEVQVTQDAARFGHKVSQAGGAEDRSRTKEVLLGFSTPNPYYDFFVRDALAYAVDDAANAAPSIKKVNEQSARQNEAIFTALERSTGAAQPRNARAWFDWWQKYTGAYSNQRESSNDRATFVYNVPYYVPSVWYRTGEFSSERIPSAGQQATARFAGQAETRTAIKGTPFISHHSCFAKGTTVATDAGEAAIETIRPGDRVLAQDIESGELAYKPVLGIISGDPIQLLKISCGVDSFDSTKGHEFWVLGKGWRMAEELKAGDRVHTSAGAVTIDRVESGPIEGTHNLVVADFHTYFVGKGRVYVHDLTPADYTAALAPGLQPAPADAAK